MTRKDKNIDPLLVRLMKRFPGMLINEATDFVRSGFRVSKGGRGVTKAAYDARKAKIKRKMSKASRRINRNKRRKT